LAIRPINPLSLRERAGERGSNQQAVFFLMYIPSSWPSPGGRRNPSFNNRIHIMLNTFSMHPDPSPKGEGFTDPLFGDSKINTI
jgi:hypothetical protein